MTVVYVAVQGGLGNQMFQAAFGLAIEKALGVEVRFLADYVAVDPYNRQFLLDRFPALRGRTAPIDETAGVPAFGEVGVSLDTLAELFGRQPKVAFHGYWQNEAYFFGQAEAIRDGFRLDAEPSMAALGDDLRAKGAIGVHVRRSEYGHHGHASVDYYRSAIDTIRQETGPAPVVCFTDEPNFCGFVFRDIADLTVMPPNTADPLNDFRLLSQCRHFVIANSSFSWWAAWLGAEAGSIVYAPDPWCVYEPERTPVPPRWRRVDNAVRSP